MAGEIKQLVFSEGATVSAPTTGTSIGEKSADYTVTDGDGIRDLLMTTGATDRTVTLPLAANNKGRRITTTKVDSGSGSVTIDGSGAETIGGATTKLIDIQYESMTVFSDGSEWFVIGQERGSWQRKALAVDVTTTDANDISDGGTDPDNPDFRFTGLVSGEIYELKMQARMNITGGAGGETVVIMAQHDSTEIAQIRHRKSSTANSSLCGGTSNVFLASASTVTFDVTIPAGGTLSTDGTFICLVHRIDLKNQSTLF